jgi:outer membrane lipoprotein-sorting protein
MNLWLATALLLQDRTVEETFKKIEETVTKAKTIRIQFKSIASGTEGAPAGEMSGTILLKEGNKALESYVWSAGGEQRNIFYASDGTHATFGSDLGRGGETYQADTFSASEGLSSRLGVALVRFGQDPLALLTCKTLFTCPAGYPCDPKAQFRLSDFNAGPDYEGLKTMTYKLMVPETTGFHLTKIWYEPLSYKVVKRTLTQDIGRGPGKERNMTETYKEWTLNADIPDEKFKLPER